MQIKKDKQEKKNKLLIDGLLLEEIRVALLNGLGQLIEYVVENNEKSNVGNVYLGRIEHIEPSIQAAFVNFGEEKSGFLSLVDINPCYYKSGSKNKNQIQDLIKKKQEVIIQVVRDQTEQKGANLTTYVSLSGTNCILLPNSKNNHGISRKIVSEDRKKLRAFLEEIDSEMCLIIRTAANFSDIKEIKTEYQKLLKIWDEIQQAAQDQKNPGLLFKDNDQLLQILRSYSQYSVDSVEVSDTRILDAIKNYSLNGLIKFPKNIKFSESDDIFEKINDQIESIYKPEVKLPSGGSLIIHQTEALVAIDVNSKTSIKEKTIEATAFQTNLEAAQEAARQIIIRNLGGLIVIDFIDMNSKENIEIINKAIKDAFKEDRAAVSILNMSEFGLVELSRQRIRKSVLNRSFMKCRNCDGSGYEMQVRKKAIQLLREIIKKVNAGAEFMKITTSGSILAEIFTNFNQTISNLQNIQFQWEAVEGISNVICCEAKTNKRSKSISRIENEETDRNKINQNKENQNQQQSEKIEQEKIRQKKINYRKFQDQTEMKTEAERAEKQKQKPTKKNVIETSTQANKQKKIESLIPEDNSKEMQNQKKKSQHNQEAQLQNGYHKKKPPQKQYARSIQTIEEYEWEIRPQENQTPKGPELALTEASKKRKRRPRKSKKKLKPSESSDLNNVS